MKLTTDSLSAAGGKVISAAEYCKGSVQEPTIVYGPVAMLDQAKVNARVVVDCSHGNSNKLHTNQV